MRYLIALIAVTLAVFGFAQRASAQAMPGLYGYAVTGSTYTSTTADWTMPSFTCGSGDNGSYVAIWTGLDGYTSDTIEQIGAEVDCAGGTAGYFGWYELYPEVAVYFSNPLAAGDKLEASVTYNGASKFTLTLEDVTAAWTKTVTGTLSAERSSAETGVETQSTLTCSPDKVLASFTDDTVDGTALGSLNPVKVTGGDSHIVVSAVSGKTFKVTCN